MRLNNVFNFIDYRGVTPNKINSGVLLLTAKNIKKGYIDYSVKEFISKNEYKNRQQRGVSKKGDILFTTEAPLGNVAIADQIIYSAGQRLITFQQYGNKDFLNNTTLMYFMLSEKFQLSLDKNKTGSTVFGIKAEKLKQILLPLPPYNEQHKIEECIKRHFYFLKQINTNIQDLNQYKNAIKNKILNSIFSNNSSYKSYYENEFVLGDILPYEQPAPYIVESTEYSDVYEMPVLTPGKTFILGYTNEKKGIYKIGDKKKVIIFDDFTTVSRLVDFDFKVKSSAMKILSSIDNNKFDTEYMYYLLQTIKINANTHKRFWISEYAPIKLKIHTYDEQLKIVKLINQTYKLFNQI